MENAAEEDFQPIEVDGNTKPVRHRKKMFYRTLRHQMEFYFSDANLTKNRFMGQRLAQDPQLELSLFLTFNKVRAMTHSVNDIAKALRKSKMLSITEDGSKVFRTTEICKLKQEDECTIYVEHLPPDAEHEWLRSIFLPYGEVPYISIPKFKISKMNKGFAFVEFDSSEAANRALKAFEEMGCRLSSQIPPDEISSNLVQDEKTDNDNDPDKDLFKKPNAKIDMFQEYPIIRKSEEKTKVEEMETETSQKGKKRRLDDYIEDIIRESEKKQKTEEATEVPNVGEEAAEGSVDTENKAEAVEMQEYNEKENEGEEDEEEEEEGKRRKSRKHKKKKNKRFDHVDPKLALRVLSKVEWKILRNKYVALQKKKMKALKHQLARSRWVENYSQPKEQKEQHSKEERRDGEPAKSAEKPLKEFTFVPDVIVRIGFKEPAIDIKAFKAAVRTHKEVVYVDASEGATEAFVRCADAEAASRFIKGQQWNDMSLIDGAKEQEYWEKITRDRDQKVKGNVANLVKRRGRDKLLKKAEKALGKHIRFDEPE